MFDLLQFGFVTVRFLDLLDIVIVAVIIYNIYKLLRGTIASQILFGLVAILVLFLIAQAMNLKALSVILKVISDIWLIAFLILFQPEIRRFLASFATNPLFQIFKRDKDSPGMVEILTNATISLSGIGHGALIVIERDNDLRQLIESGTTIDAKASSMLLRSIFVPGSPLHDGAVVIRDDRIVAARCSIPFSKEEHFNMEGTGMRHKAALTHSAEYDSIVIIVSEETRTISVAKQGNLTRGLTRDSLTNILKESLVREESRTRFKLFDRFLNKQ